MKPNQSMSLKKCNLLRILPLPSYFFLRITKKDCSRGPSVIHIAVCSEVLCYSGFTVVKELDDCFSCCVSCPLFRCSPLCNDIEYGSENFFLELAQ